VTVVSLRGRRDGLQRSRRGNPFGLAEAFIGLVVGFVLSYLALSVYDSAAHVAAGADTFAQTVISLVGLWFGFVGGTVFAASLARSRGDEPAARESSWSARLRADFGLQVRLWPDVPLGLAVGIASQYVLVPLLELPLHLFVSHLGSRLGHPTRELLGPVSSASTAELVVVSILVCVGSPLVEELFFRGLFLRGALFRTASLGRRLGPATAIVLTGIFFALVHFEALQFIGLAGFGIVLSLLAWWSGRLGPSIVAHVTFNTTAVLVYLLTR
jgi:membrane protease YdiL (CAAX protease family)